MEIVPTAIEEVLVNNTVSLTQAVLCVKDAFGFGFTVTVTSSVLTHPVSVTEAVKVYSVVMAGDAFGLEIVLLLKPATGVHAYVTPATDAIPSAAESSSHMILSGPAFATGL